MHYGPRAFTKDPTKRTIVAKNGAHIGQREQLSAMDKERIQIFYGCLKPVSLSPDMNL